MAVPSPNAEGESASAVAFRDTVLEVPEPDGTTKPTARRRMKETAFFTFCRLQRTEVATRHPGISAVAIAKLLGFYVAGSQ